MVAIPGAPVGNVTPFRAPPGYTYTPRAYKPTASNVAPFVKPAAAAPAAAAPVVTAGGIGAAATAGAIVAAAAGGLAIGNQIAEALNIKYPGELSAGEYLQYKLNGGVDRNFIPPDLTQEPSEYLIEGPPEFTGGQGQGVPYNVNIYAQFAVSPYPNGVNSIYRRNGPIRGIKVESVESGGVPGKYWTLLHGHTPNVGSETVLGQTPNYFPFPPWQGGNRDNPGEMKIVDVQRADGEPDLDGNPSGPPSRYSPPLGATPSRPIPPPEIPPLVPPPPQRNAPPPPQRYAPPPSNVPPPETPTEPEPPPGIPPFAPIIPPPMPAPPGKVAPPLAPPVSPGRGIRQPTNPGEFVDPEAPPAAKKPTDPPTNCGCNKSILDAIGGLAELFGAGANATGEAVSTVVLLKRLNEMQSFAEKAWKATQMDKVLNLLTFISVLHNASMLSRDIGETLGYAVDNALNAMGIPIKDETGSQISINDVIGRSVTNFIKGVLGDDVYNELRENYLKANRVIQSASMIIWSIRSIGDATLDLMEWVGSNTGRIGNALKRFGLVGERAYPWMSENPQGQHRFRARFDRLTGGLERAEDFASSFATATSNVLEITQETNELGQNFDAFKSSVTELTEDLWDDHTGVKAAADQQAAAAQSPPIATADSDKG